MTVNHLQLNYLFAYLLTFGLIKQGYLVLLKLPSTERDLPRKFYKHKKSSSIVKTCDHSTMNKSLNQILLSNSHNIFNIMFSFRQTLRP